MNSEPDGGWNAQGTFCNYGTQKTDAVRKRWREAQKNHRSTFWLPNGREYDAATGVEIARAPTEPPSEGKWVELGFSGGLIITAPDGKPHRMRQVR